MRILSFLRTFIKKPKEVSAFIPTLRRVAESIVNHIPLSANLVVEYGPGNGVVTKKILEHLAPGSKVIAIEILDEFVDVLKKINDPRLKVVKGNVLQKSLDLSEESVDVILSSIPLSRLEKNERRKLIEVSAKALKSGGKMIIYYQTSKLSLPILENIFKEVEWHFDPRNFTPYFILIAKK